MEQAGFTLKKSYFNCKKVMVLNSSHFKFFIQDATTKFDMNLFVYHL